MAMQSGDKSRGNMIEPLPPKNCSLPASARARSTLKDTTRRIPERPTDKLGPLEVKRPRGPGVAEDHLPIGAATSGFEPLRDQARAHREVGRVEEAHHASPERILVCEGGTDAARVHEWDAVSNCREH